MKIAVLFGSFNPMTNAHMTAMKKAVESLNADRGLFVATNGDYLKRKTVKINDPFYLTEDERREIIEKVCEGEDKLSFGMFELGGINPSRFKTLCKLQKLYPEATLYEVMGADKVHTLYKSSCAEDYLSQFKFAILHRDGIDLEAMFTEQSLLADHKDSFVFLPALEEEAEISSTDVRRRFYAGEDYSDIVHPATVEVLSHHKASDFSISFAERMQVMMKTGRFGENNARKEVYKENLKLFLEWKDGKSHIDFGDYQAFLDGAKLYKAAYNVNDIGVSYPETLTGCINIDCVDLAEHLIAKGYNPAILNLASAKRTTGGYREGMGAQEESLCRSSNLSLSLFQYGDPKYIYVRESGVPAKEIGYPLNLNYGGIYTPKATFFRNNKDKFYTLRDTTFKCDVITVAALSFTGRMDYSYANELSYRAPDGGFTAEGEEIMLNKIRTIFRMGVEHGKDSLVLGAFGCGAYKLPAADVARLFKRVMNESEFVGKFRLITFAILESSRYPGGLEGKFAPFYQEFGAYTME